MYIKLYTNKLQIYTYILIHLYPLDLILGAKEYTFKDICTIQAKLKMKVITQALVSSQKDEAGKNMHFEVKCLDLR